MWFATGLAALSIIVAAAPLPRLFAGDSGLQSPVLPAPQGKTPLQVPIDPIIELSPFGRLIGAVSGTPARQEPLPGLTLHGVVIAEPPQNSTAIISGTVGPAEVYRIGDEISAVGSLEAIFFDHVELLIDGTSQALYFPQPGRTEAAGSVTEEGDLDALRELIAGEAADYSAKIDPASSDAAPGPDGAPEDIATRIQRYRDTIRDDPQMLLAELGLAAFEDGYRVSMTASDELLSAGLLPGDIVSTVNGQQVGNIERDKVYFDEVIATGHARITLLRQGERIVVSLPTR